jgi:uncharacterized protein
MSVFASLRLCVRLLFLRSCERTFANHCAFSPGFQDQLFAHWAALCSIFFLLNFFLLTLSAFFAGFVDATVGGGGLVQLPALFAILPAQSPPQLLGTNKLAAITGTINASIAFCRRVTLPVRFMILTCLAAGIGSLIGAQVTRFISPELFKLGLPVLLLGLLIYTLKHKRLGDLSAVEPFGPKAIVQGCLIGAGIGFYDGFIGPGTGTFLIFLFIRVFRFDFLHASAAAKLVNVSTNLGAILLFGFTGNILWPVAIPMAIANAVGGIVGARYALRKGNTYVRGFFVIVVCILLAKTAWDGWNELVALAGRSR